MTTRAIPSFSLACLALLSACGSTPKQVESVARTDLGCEQISIAEIAKNRYAASGCGKGGVYAQLCGNGQACSWVRLRGAQDAPAMSSGGAVAPAEPREIIQAPPPAPREIIQAPPPASAPPREIIQAPPPAPSAPSSALPGSQQTGSSVASTSVDLQTQQAYGAQQTSLSDGALSQPYQAEVPVQPMAQQVQYPPPAPLVETQPPPPQPNYVWSSGYWSWSNSNWLWAPGYWMPPMYGYNYVPGSWYWSNNYWYYGPGGWARPGSTYISYGLGPRPYRQAYTRSFTPYRVASAYPSRVGSYPLHQGHGVGPAPAGRGFAPQSSPLYHYPSSAGSPLSHSQSPGAMHTGPQGGFGGFGRGTQSYSAPAHVGGSPYNGGGGYNSNAFNGGHSGHGSTMGRMPSAPASSPSYAPSHAPTMGRMGGGGGGMGGGGGGRFGAGGPGRMGAGPSHGGGRR